VSDRGLAAPSADELERLLRGVSFFRSLDRVDIARLIGALTELEVPAATVLFSEGAEADGLYLLESGSVEVTLQTNSGPQRLAQLDAPAHFGELGLFIARRSADVRTLTGVRLWKLSRDRFEQLVRDKPTVGLTAATSAIELLRRSQRELVGAPAATPAEPPMIIEVPPRRPPLAWRLTGFAVAVGVPLILWPLPAPGGLSVQGWHVSLVVLGAALGWLFEPLPDFLIALLMAAAWGIAGLAPLSLIFAGFATPSWIVALGALALAITMARSGLLLRTALFLLRTFPATHVGQTFALLVGGIVITPLVPLALARVAAVAPLTQELCETLGYPPRSRARAALAFGGLIGYGMFSSIFLTGLVMNFFVVDLLPPPEQVRFGWLTWLASAAPAGAVLLIGGAVVLLALFRPDAAPKATPQILRRQERALGSLSARERVTIAAIAVLLVGLLLQPFLHIDTAWLAIGALGIAIAGNALDREGFRGAIDWGFLTFFGILLGAGGVLHQAGVDGWIAESLVPLARAVGDRGALIVLLAALVVACRLVLPWIPATLLLSLALVPAAARLGLSPWVVGFVVLMAANTWLHPNQSDFYRLMRGATHDEMFTKRHGLVAGVAMTVVTLIAIAASVPYWRAIGLLA